MIDFRYHIVSLISVFLALAVGIILGAGPLKESIGDQLTGQVEVLRTEKDELRVELDGARSQLTGTEAYLTASAPVLLDGALLDRRVGIVALGPVDDAVYTGIEQQITAAGGTVSVRVQVGQAWTAEDQADSRQSYADTLRDYLTDTSGNGYDATLARALVEAMTGEDPADPQRFSSDAALIREILTSSGLVEVVGEVTAPADAIVILAPDLAVVTDGEGPERDADAVQAANEIYQNLADAAQAGSEGAVIAGGSLTDGDLVSWIRADQSRAGSISTVTDAHRITGQITVPLAVAARIGSQVGHFGSDENATALVPPSVVLTPVDRTPTGAVGVDDPATEPADG